jgi:hypothetical protein
MRKTRAHFTRDRANSDQEATETDKERKPWAGAIGPAGGEGQSRAGEKIQARRADNTRGESRLNLVAGRLRNDGKRRRVAAVGTVFTARDPSAIAATTAREFAGRRAGRPRQRTAEPSDRLREKREDEENDGGVSWHGKPEFNPRWSMIRQTFRTSSSRPPRRTSSRTWPDPF